jgi:hypothetical protein
VAILPIQETIADFVIDPDGDELAKHLTGWA